MKPSLGPVLALLLSGAGLLNGTAASRETINFDNDWHFLKADAVGAEMPDFNDSSWRKLNVPHDWSIEGPFASTNSTRGSGGFLPSGIGWYRKEFTLKASDTGRCAFIEFDGVMANSDVWINGHHLGKRPYGYVSFGYELTPYLKPGETNVLAVRADNSAQPASRWYSGAGIYRHVRLVVTDPVHIEAWSTFITTPQIANGQATVRAQTSVTNESQTARKISLRLSLTDAAGNFVASADSGTETISANHSVQLAQSVVVKNPELWNLENPVLYQARLEVVSESKVLDTDKTPFGIREFEFKADTGFWLNGKNFKLKGVCVHHDGSAFGAAVPLSVWEQRLTALRELGVNAIRTAHNPPAPEFLDLCDRMGFLVMDEFFDCWTVAKNPFDYHLNFNEWSKIDARDTIRRDRNHPSIILYSVGNEIHDTPKEELAKSILKGLVEVCHENDPTRPVTQALFRPNVSHDYDNGLADMLDVIGTNYRDLELLAAQRVKPTRKIIGTEQGHDRRTWLNLRDNPSHSGQFLWTGIDYLGESRRWPIVAAGSGLLDRTGVARPLGRERQSWWSDQPMVFISRRVAATGRTSTDPGFDPLDRSQVLFADWTPRNAEPHEEDVEIYSNVQEVELFLNGKSLGTKPLPTDASSRNWKVQFEPGVLKAVARSAGKVVASQELRTAGKAAAIKLMVTPERLSPVRDDVAKVTATVVDEHGIPVPGAEALIKFSVAGPGEIVAVDSADNSSHEPFQSSERQAFQGTCVAFVRALAAGKPLDITAAAAGLENDSIRIETRALK